jgi:acetylornithine/N-succinyldiaminopimelate aminotransferase
MSFSSLQAKYSDFILPTYARYPAAFVKGSGCRLWDTEGKEYIDFASGIGVCAIGHAHPKWVEAIAAQAAALAHTSNLFYTEPGARLAERLCQLSGLQAVFFANSGAEANEGLIKLARKYSADKYGANRAAVLTLNGSFHGRTVTTLAATGQEHFHKHFHPFTPGFRHVPPNDTGALETEGDDVCALLLEPVQGEGGVLPLDAGYVKQAATLCEKRDWLLLMDEVQTGIGRTGSWFGFQGLGVKPDALSFAKGIAGGLPFGGFLVNEKLRGTLQPGDHATTFGGNPLCAAAALSTLDILEPVIPSVHEKGKYIRSKIEAMDLPNVAATRGKGLMIGIQIQNASPRDINAKLLDAGLVGLTAGTDAVRFLPPLVIEKEDMDAGLEIVEKVMRGM